MKSWLIRILIVVVLVSTIHISEAAKPRPVAGASVCCGLLSYNGLPWYIIRVYGSVGYNGSKVWLNWIDCTADTVSSTVSFTWCGAYRYSTSKIDVGANWQVTIGPFGWHCWARRTFWANGIGSITTRSGCG